jgi:hypothetical protein
MVRLAKVNSGMDGVRHVLVLASRESTAAECTVTDAAAVLPTNPNSHEALLLKNCRKRAGRAHSPCTVSNEPPADATMVGATPYTGALPMKLML